MTDNLKLIAVPHETGMAIYLTGRGIEPVYVMLHRKNQRLYHYLHEGRRLQDVRTYRPGRNTAQQKLRHSLDHITRTADYLINEGYVA